MKRFASYIILCSLLLFYACEPAVKNHGKDNDGMLLVNLDIHVALSDVSNALTKTTEYADAANNNEKMHTLRIIIVRPDWTVEANRWIDLKDAATLMHNPERFRVKGNETKWIYLFVNENTTVTDKNTKTTRKLVDFDLNSIKEGGYFPINAIEGLKIRLENNTEQIDGPLPMSERHKFTVTEEPEQECNLFVTRAAVKFSLHIINEIGRSITFDGFSIDKMANMEWYMPRATYDEPNEDGQREITTYEVPAETGYYTYDKNLYSDAVTINPYGEKVLDPIYLLEGKYTDDPNNEGHNYSMEISLNNITGRYYFPNLPTLPRNTHVVVRITYKDFAKVTCEVDVIPYSEIILEPGFGL